MRFYGLSSITRVYLPSGRAVDCTDASARFAAPDFGNPDRSLPVVDTDDEVDIAWLRRDRWATDPKRVERTADEVEFIALAKEEGAVTTQVMARAFAEAAAKAVADNAATAAKPSDAANTPAKGA